ncbi:MAG: magnesium chelatase subunit D family protein [Coriobacteriia bacterium]|nr:magnesium chelatase subunit D family protein [Coriobacteriia bacterium]
MHVRPGSCYPFSAIVGQDTLRTSLLVNAVDHRVGGVLIRGQKGTAKSTAVRALAAVLPAIDVVEGCRYSCDPAEPASWCRECRARRDEGPLPTASRPPRIVDLPVSATEDRLVGTLDIERALKTGEKGFEPGLLADANRGILYVDEVNLLDDHLVDTLLDAAAMGVNVVQREGIAHSHPARFMLVGTMNPEEGEVRPQLLDRFGLCVDVEGIADPRSRVEIVKRRQAFEEDGVAFARKWADEEAGLGTALRHARLRLSRIRLDDDVLLAIAETCAAVGVDGHRADITLARASVALAALEDSCAADLEHVRRMAPLVLAHRVRREPFDERDWDQGMLPSVLSAPPGADADGDPSSADTGAGCGAGDASRVLTLGVAGEAPSSPMAEARLVAPLDRSRRSSGGRRQETLAEDGRGRYSRSEVPKPGAPADIAVDATLRAAAARQSEREGAMALQVRPEDVRNKVRTRRVGVSVVFCVDASGSMRASSRMETAKAAVLDLLADAYRRRDRVGLVSFRGDGADVVLPPTSSVELARLKLRSIPTGGATPLASGISRGLELLEAERRRDAEVVPWLVLVTDGRANVGLAGGLGSEDARAMAARVRATKVNALVIDTDTGPARNGAARDIARSCAGEYVRLSSFDAPSVASAVRDRVGG